nr:site-specific DNA-methyltransferase [uncultured Bacteroides sp.]
MDGKSRNLTEDYIQQIKALFPEAVTEVADNEGNHITHKIDMEKLAILLGEAAIPTDETEYRQKYGEKFSFEWAGKRRAIAEAQKRSTGTLRPCLEESVDWDKTENLYIEGDNLEVLKLLQDSYIGAVKMIYIDPPYNTGKDFVYKDNYKDNLANYLEQTNTTNAVNSEASGRYHTNWLNMMYPRLKLARNLLTEDGVIFISIDDNEVSNLKSICDEVFGEDNFVGLIVIKSNPRGSMSEAKLASLHEYLLVYAKKIIDTAITGHVISENMTSEYKYIENNRYYRLLGLRQRGGFWRRSERPNLYFPIYISPKDGSISLIQDELHTEMVLPIQPTTGEEGTWRWSKEKIEKENSDLLGKQVSRDVFLVWDVYQRDYLDKYGSTVRRTKAKSIWDEKEINYQNGTIEIKQLLHGGAFDYAKPIFLIKRAIEMLDVDNSIILDFFSGSATTAHAVMQLNAEDAGNRKYICVQIPEPTPDNSEARKAGYNTIPEIAKERIRRAGKKILEEQKAKNDGLFADEAPKLDIGFKVFKLDRSNVKEWDVELEGLNEQQAAIQLQAEFNKTLDILKDGRTELDILYEVMLKLGLLLTTHVKEVDIEGKKAFVVGDGIMVASFAKELTYAQISKMLDLKAKFVQAGEFKVVFADESFASDNDKTNAMQLFKQRGITNYEII